MTLRIKNSVLYGIAFVLSFVSLSYELLIAETISALATNSVLWYSVTVGLYLAALGFGSLVCLRICNNKDKFVSLFKVEMALSILGGASVIFLHMAHAWASDLWAFNFFNLGIGVFFFIAFFFIVSIGFLSGLEIPLLIQIYKKYSQEKKSVNRILACDYFGSLSAGVLFPLYLVPHFSLFAISFMMAFINLIIAFFIMFIASFNLFSKEGYLAGEARLQEKYKRWEMEVGGILVLVFLAILCFAFIKVDFLQQYFLRKYYYADKISEGFKLKHGVKGHAVIERIISQYQKIDIVNLSENEDNFLSQNLFQSYKNRFPEDIYKEGVYPDRKNSRDNYALFLDRSFQFSQKTEEFYHEYFAHVPMILNGRIPRNILILGGGDGLLLREIIKYSQIERITLVEIDRHMIDLAVNHPIIRKINRDSINDPRVSFIISDAYTYARRHKESYDAIFMDFPEATNYNLSKIYSSEFYSAIKNILNEDGFIAFDCPGIDAMAQFSQENNSKSSLAIYLSTLVHAGFKKSVVYESRLETDHPEAREIVGFSIKDAGVLNVREFDVNGEHVAQVKGRENIISRILEDFSMDHKQSFIFVKKSASDEKVEYIDYGLKHNILNKKRFFLALNPDLGRVKTSAGLVNSVMKPSLPQSHFWWRLKFPY